MGKAFKISPINLLADWGYVEDWSEGDSSAPTGWLMAGTAGSVSKESTEKKFGNYAMKIISGSSASYKAENSYSNYTALAGRTITFGMYVKCSSANKARLYIYDGMATVNSSYHSGGGDWEFLEVEIQVDESNTELTFGCEVQSSLIAAYFDCAICCEGEDLFFELDSSDVDVQDWSPKPKLERTIFKIPSRPGVLMPDVKYGRKDIKIKMAVVGSDYSACRTMYDSVNKAVVGGEKELYLFDDRIQNARLINISKLQYKASLLIGIFTLSFIAEDPFNRYICKTRKKQTISSSPASFNLSCLGNVEVFPVISFQANGADMTNCTLKNLTTGQSMNFTGTVLDGNILEIDCANRTVKNNGVNSTSNFTAAGHFIKFISGTNYLKFTGDNCIIKIDWYNKWI